MTAHQIGDIESRNFASFDDPIAPHHDPIRPVRAAQYKGCERIPMAGKAKLIELEQREIRHLTRCDLA